MTLEIDHLFIITDPDAPEADCLARAGFTEGSPNHHTAQGTACRRFFFVNAMLEFIWIRDARESLSGVALRTGLMSRALGRSNGGSPFGICFRSSTGSEPPPFATWQYSPAYLPKDGPPYEISVRSEIVDDPFLFYRPYAERPDRYPPERAEPTAHGCGAKALTQTHLLCPTASSPELRALSSVPGFTVEQAPKHHLHLTLDNGRHGRCVRFPSLPLSIEY